MKFETISEFIDNGGRITIGRMGPCRCAAVASDHHAMLAALKRRQSETVVELLERLETALALAIEQDVYTDEINS